MLCAARAVRRSFLKEAATAAACRCIDRMIELDKSRQEGSEKMARKAMIAMRRRCGFQRGGAFNAAARLDMLV